MMSPTALQGKKRRLSKQLTNVDSMMTNLEANKGVLDPEVFEKRKQELAVEKTKLLGLIEANNTMIGATLETLQAKVKVASDMLAQVQKRRDDNAALRDAGAVGKLPSLMTSLSLFFAVGEAKRKLAATTRLRNILLESGSDAGREGGPGFGGVLDFVAGLGGVPRLAGILLAGVLICAIVYLFAAGKSRAEVTARSGLLMRTAPLMSAPTVTLIPYAEKVTVISDDGPEETLYGVTGKWMKVEYSGASGWAFGGFLERKASFRFPNVFRSVMTKAEYQAAVSKVMRDLYFATEKAKKDMPDASRIRSWAEFRDAFVPLQQAVERAEEELAAMRPPHEIESEHNQLVTGMHETAAVIAETSRIFGNGDLSALQTFSVRVRDWEANLRDIERKMESKGYTTNLTQNPLINGDPN